jgi:hypothetical protein
MAETSTKPYLIRAIHEWCTDNGFTPYLAVSVDERTVVPREHVRNGEIVLNVSMLATHRLALGNELIEFQARFGGPFHGRRHSRGPDLWATPYDGCRDCRHTPRQNNGCGRLVPRSAPDRKNQHPRISPSVFVYQSEL